MGLRMKKFKIVLFLLVFSSVLLCFVSLDFALANDASATTPYIKITSPNGGEKWEWGKSYEITWEQKNIKSVDIGYSQGPGSLNWIETKIEVSPNATTGKYVWNLNNADSCVENNTFKIVIFGGADNAYLKDESDEYFSLGPKPINTENSYIKLISPENNEEWRAFETHKITWNYNDIDFVSLSYFDGTSNEYTFARLDVDYPERGLTKTVVDQNTIQMTYDWEIPWRFYSDITVVTNKKDFKIKIVGIKRACDPKNNYTVSDESINFLRLLESPELKFTNYVAAPMAPMTLYSGDTYRVSWNQYGIDSVDIYYAQYEYPYKEHSEYRLIVKDLKAPSSEDEWAREGFYDWKIPENLDPDYTDPMRRYHLKAIGYDNHGKTVLDAGYSNVFSIFLRKKPDAVFVENYESNKIQKEETKEEPSAPAASNSNNIILNSETDNKVIGFSFLDVSEDNDLASINLLKDLKIIHGYPDGTFKPKNKINRAEFSKIVIEAKYGDSDISGSNCFPDVSEDWFAKYVCTAKAKGIISGYANGKFLPDSNINLVEAYKILSLLFFDGKINYEIKAPWYAKYVKTAQDNNFSLELTESTPITREQMAIMVAKIINSSSPNKEKQDTVAFVLKGPEKYIKNVQHSETKASPGMTIVTRPIPESLPEYYATQCNFTVEPEESLQDQNAVDSSIGSISLNKNIVYQTYPVSGSNHGEVRASLDQNRPKLFDGNRCNAITEWNFGFSGYSYDSSNDYCDIDWIEIGVNIIVTLPEWINIHKASEEDQAMWNAYISNLIRHEQGHVNLALQGVRSLQAVLAGSVPATTSCNVFMDSSYSKVLAAMRQADLDYDARVGSAQGIIFPLYCGYSGPAIFRKF